MSAISQVFPLNSVRPTNVGTTTCPTKKDVGEAIRNNKFSGLQVAHGNINHLPNADQQVKSKDLSSSESSPERHPDPMRGQPYGVT